MRPVMLKRSTKRRLMAHHLVNNTPRVERPHSYLPLYLVVIVAMLFGFTLGALL